MSKSSEISIGKILISIFILIIIALIVSSVLFYNTYSDGFSKPFQHFYVEHESNMILKESHMTMTKNKEYRFDCKDTFKFLGSEGNQCSGYTVSVYANYNAQSFNLTLDGVSRSYDSLGDISAAFNITKSNTYFTIKPDKTMQEVLSAVYPTKQIVLPADKTFTDDFYYLLVIGNKSGGNFVFINFKVAL